MAARRPWKASWGLRSSLSHFPMASTMRSSARPPKKPVTRPALDFGTTDSTQPGVETNQLAAAAMLTEPLNNQHITEPKPTIKTNLASMGDVDPKSVEMRISGFGLVPAVYDPKTKLVTYIFTQKLVPKMYTVILTAKVNGKKVETRWDFTVDPARPVAP